MAANTRVDVVVMMAAVGASVRRTSARGAADLKWTKASKRQLKGRAGPVGSLWRPSPDPHAEAALPS